MPTAPDNHDGYNYAGRIRERQATKQSETRPNP